MTNNNSPRRRNVRTCTDCKKQLNSSNTRHYRADDTCDACMEIAGIENNHQDGYHEADAEGPNDDCPMCTGEPIADASRKGHAGSTIPREMQNHTACYAAGTHAKDKAGRAACRKGRNA